MPDYTTFESYQKIFKDLQTEFAEQELKVQNELTNSNLDSAKKEIEKLHNLANATRETFFLMVEQLEIIGAELYEMPKEDFVKSIFPLLATFVEEEKGMEMIIFLQDLKGIKTSYSEALKGWRQMSEDDRQKTKLAYAFFHSDRKPNENDG